MSYSELLAHVDHTLLRPTATWEEIRAVCDDGLRYHTASVCLPASFVEAAARYGQGALNVCTVIGFPNGYDTTAVKCFAAADAVKNGAGEVDMVINLGWLKEGRFDAVTDEIRQVKAACGGHILKVIIETCLLTEEEKIRMCAAVSDAGADFIKTSTGFSTGGATLADIRLFAAHVAPGVRIKAAGGIRSLEDAAAFLEAGASRLGTSAVVRLVKEQEVAGR